MNMKNIILLICFTIVLSCNKNDFYWEIYPSKLPCPCNSVSPDFYISSIVIPGIIENMTSATPTTKIYQKKILNFKSNNTYSLTVSTNTNDGNVYVFFDWNKNYIFDSNELVIKTKPNSKNQVLLDFTVPKDAIIGKSYCRIIYRLYGLNGFDGPCESMLYGEVEDYMINVER
jgi:hypothetical protein